MRYQVLVKSAPENMFSAVVLGVPDCVAEGRTREEALAKAREALLEQMSQGELFTIEVDDEKAPKPTHPLLEVAGSLRDDPTFDDFMAEIAAYRRQVDEREAGR